MIVVIVGATGTGKTSLSLDLADRLTNDGRRAEIVNADAMQLYRGMDIGTAKLAVGERRGIPHHLLDLLDPTEEASVAAYQRDARSTIDSILERDAVPILVGGSGLYVSSVIFDFKFPGTDPAIRERLEAELIEVGPGQLYRALAGIDPQAAEAIGPHNGRRIVRALEVNEMTGRSFGSGLPDESAYRLPTTLIGLATPREVLVPRLDARVSEMWSRGIVDETRSILSAVDRPGFGVTAARAIGYSQAIAQIGGLLTEQEAVEQTRALTRKYARRQVGWFRRYPSIDWLDSDAPDRVDLSWQLLLEHA